MSISFVTEMPGSASRSNGEVTIIRNLKYHVTGASDPRDILFDSHIPSDGTVHPDKAGYYVTGVSAPQRESGTNYDGAYTVAVDYGLPSKISMETKTKDSTKKPWEQGILDISFDSIDVVVPQLKYYKKNDTRDNPTGAMIHPATGEQLISDTKETHTLTNIKYALKSFRYGWIRDYRGTTNLAAVCILGAPIPAKNAIITKFSAAKKKFTDGRKEIFYWEIDLQIEDFGHEVTKSIALQGYHCKINKKITNIQLKNGVFGNFNDPSLNIPTPRFVDVDGVVLPAGGNVIDRHYLETPDIFTTNWHALNVPRDAT